MTLEEEWQERLRSAVAETLRRRAARAAVRSDLDAARQAGLAARHRQKLARLAGAARGDAAPLGSSLRPVAPPAADFPHHERTAP